jgi:hypothetical protein
LPQEQENTERALTSLMAGEVRDYLLEHPDFLVDNSDLLATLIPPSLRHGDKVEDFQGYMLARLQDNFTAIKDEHDDLLQLMQEHLQRQNRINAAILSLLDAKDFAGALGFITHDLRLLLDQEAVGLFLEAGGALQEGHYAGLHVVPEGFVATHLGEREIVLEEKAAASPVLFGEKAGAVRSQALVRLSISDELPPGLLAFGHREAMYYATGLATEQMETLGAVVERCLNKWLV